MKSRKQKKSTLEWWLVIIIAGLALAAVMLALPASPATASPLAQDGYPIDTETPTPTNTSAVSPTASATVTATRSGTLPAPQPTGTRTQIIPVTGADLTQDPQGGE